MIELQFCFGVILLHEHQEGERALDVSLNGNLPVPLDGSPTVQLVISVRSLDQDVSIHVSNISISIHAIYCSVSNSINLQLLVSIADKLNKDIFNFT